MRMGLPMCSCVSLRSNADDSGWRKAKYISRTCDTDANLRSVWMRIGTPSNSVNCLEAEGVTRALLAAAIRVPRPAAGMITITLIAGLKYTRLGGGTANLGVFGSRFSVFGFRFSEAS